MKDKKNIAATEEPQTLQAEERTFTCSECGENFEKPLLANLSSQGHVQSYYACPRCLAVIRENDQTEAGSHESSLSQETLEEERPTLRDENCQHFLGYLKKRPRETAIPEACLTCTKIIECMATG